MGRAQLQGVTDNAACHFSVVVRQPEEAPGRLPPHPQLQLQNKRHVPTRSREVGNKVCAIPSRKPCDVGQEKQGAVGA
eukprot:13598143-Alexandrium_andersonii.AAC.1